MKYEFLEIKYTFSDNRTANLQNSEITEHRIYRTVK